jgi:hypothetical protein
MLQRSGSLTTKIKNSVWEKVSNIKKGVPTRAGAQVTHLQEETEAQCVLV